MFRCFRLFELALTSERKPDRIASWSFFARGMRFWEILVLCTTSSRLVPIGYIAKSGNPETAKFLKLLKGSQ